MKKQILAVLFAGCLIISCKKAEIINKPPVANAGPDQTIVKPRNFVRIDGSLSHDPDGKIVSYQWTTISGPTSPSMWNFDANPKPEVKNVSNLEEGVYLFELLTTDDDGQSARDTMKVTVLPDSLISDPGRIKRFDKLWWGNLCEIRINNISSAVPSTAGMQVFICGYADLFGSGGWISLGNVASSSFWYEIKNDVLIIHAPANIDCNFDSYFYDVLLKWN